MRVVRRNLRDWIGVKLPAACSASNDSSAAMVYYESSAVTVTTSIESEVDNMIGECIRPA